MPCLLLRFISWDITRSINSELVDLRWIVFLDKTIVYMFLMIFLISLRAITDYSNLIKSVLSLHLFSTLLDRLKFVLAVAINLFSPAIDILSSQFSMWVLLDGSPIPVASDWASLKDLSDSSSSSLSKEEESSLLIWDYVLSYWPESCFICR